MSNSFLLFKFLHHTYLGTLVNTHSATVFGLHRYVIPNSALYFLHFRSCKPDWLGVPCQNLTQTVKNLHILDRFSGMMFLSMNKLPLEELIPDTNYVNYVRSNMKSSAIIKKRHVDIDTQNNVFLTDQIR